MTGFPSGPLARVSIMLVISSSFPICSHFFQLYVTPVMLARLNYTHVRTHTHARAQERTHTRARTHTRTHTHAHAHAHAHTHTRTHAHTHTRTHARTHARTHTHTHTHTHTTKRYARPEISNNTLGRQVLFNVVQLGFFKMPSRTQSTEFDN